MARRKKRQSSRSTPTAIGPMAAEQSPVGPLDAWSRHSKAYVFPIGVETRLRVWIYAPRGGNTERFAVSLEAELSGGDWRCVASIDNWHGKTHRHVYAPSGDRIGGALEMLNSMDVDQAVDWATEELTSRQEAYVTQFRSLY